MQGNIQVNVATDRANFVLHMAGKLAALGAVIAYSSSGYSLVCAAFGFAGSLVYQRVADQKKAKQLAQHSDNAFITKAGACAPIQQAANKIADQLECRHPSVYICRGADTMGAKTLSNGDIIVAEGVVETLPSAQQNAILAHEIFHVQANHKSNVELLSHMGYAALTVSAVDIIGGSLLGPVPVLALAVMPLIGISYGHDTEYNADLVSAKLTSPWGMMEVLTIGEEHLGGSLLSRARALLNPHPPVNKRMGRVLEKNALLIMRQG